MTINITFWYFAASKVVDSFHIKRISVSNYRSGAIERAAEAGIKLLNVTGLTKNHLAAAVAEAFQSVVHLILEVKSVEVINTNEEPSPLNAVLFTEDQQAFLILHDLIWVTWLQGEVPPIVGKHKLNINIPEWLFQEIDGRLERPISLTADVDVIGLVFTYRGQTTQHSLVNAHDGKTEKWKLEARFDAPDPPISFATVRSEEELAKHVDKPDTLRLLTGRFLLPRIVIHCRFGWLYWPPSERTFQKMKSLEEAFQDGEIIDPQVFSEEPLESKEADAVFDPITERYPLKITFGYE